MATKGKRKLGSHCKLGRREERSTMVTEQDEAREAVRAVVEQPIRCLAAAVLLDAVKAEQVERTIIMEFWCDVVDIDPEVFFARAREGVN